MSYVEIIPKSKKAEEILLENKEKIFDGIGQCILDVFRIPETDMILELHRCTVIATDERAVRLESAPDVVIKLSTSDMEFKEKAEELSDRIVDSWNNILGKAVTMELWIRFFHTWGCNIDFD